MKGVGEKGDIVKSNEESELCCNYFLILRFPDHNTDLRLDHGAHNFNRVTEGHANAVPANSSRESWHSSPIPSSVTVREPASSCLTQLLRSEMMRAFPGRIHSSQALSSAGQMSLPDQLPADMSCF